MADILSMVSDAREVVKTVASVDGRIKLAAALDSVSELQEKNYKLKHKVKKLKKRLAAMKRMESYGGAYYVLEDDGRKVGPVCPLCYQQKRVIVILERERGSGHCPSCRTRYPGIKASVEGYKQVISY